MFTIIDEDGLEVARISKELLDDITLQLGHDAVTPSADEWKPPKRWKVEERTGL